MGCATSTTISIERLKRRADFLGVAATRQGLATPGVLLQARLGEQDHGKSARVGFTASKRVGNAVARNRAKRRLRAAADAILGDRARPGSDYVLIARDGTLTRPYADLLCDLARAVQAVHDGRAVLRRRAGKGRGKGPRQATDGANR